MSFLYDVYLHLVSQYLHFYLDEQYKLNNLNYNGNTKYSTKYLKRVYTGNDFSVLDVQLNEKDYADFQ